MTENPQRLSDQVSDSHSISLVTQCAAKSGKNMSGSQYYATLAFNYSSVFLGKPLDIWLTKAGAVAVPVLKQRVREEELRDPTTKKLAVLLHHFPLATMFEHLVETVPQEHQAGLVV